MKPVENAKPSAGSKVPLVDTEDALNKALPQLTKPDRIAIDTEADSLHCYFEKLCLIQVAVPGSEWLIDPLAPISLEPFFAALAGKELILHGADYDLRLLRRVGYPGPERIFDTMIAARLCGFTEFSLAALLKRFFDLTVPKGSQKANWARRPLSSTMIEYAVNDTRYLHQIAEFFEMELRKLGRLEWFQQMCERAIRVTESSKERDSEDAWRIPGSGVLRGRPAAILRELWKWRDLEARTIDKPSFHIMHNDLLLQTAVRLDRGEPVEFKHLRGTRLTRFQEACQRGVAMPQSEWPVFVRQVRSRPTPSQEERFKVLKKRRDAVARELQLDPSLVPPKPTLEGLAFAPEETLLKLLPWQKQVLGLERGTE